MELKTKKIKLFILQNNYKNISNIILKFQNHINNIYLNNFIDTNQKNNLINNIFTISKNINTLYNNYILNELENNDNLDILIIDLLELFSDIIDTDILYNKIYKYICNIKPKILPLNKLNELLLKLIFNNGYSNIIELIKLFGNIELSDLQTKLINEISNIFIPIKIELNNNNNNNNDIFWTIPNQYYEIDILELERELWIKNSNNTFIKISGYFINDNISSIVKNSQLNYIFFQTNKQNIINKLQNSSINQKFIRKFLRYNYLGNIYVLSTNEYTKYIEEMYQQHMELINSSFVNIMKNFISNGSKIKKMYDTIFLLLLGNNDNFDVASLLLGLTKEKKNKNTLIYNIICNRLPHYLLSKIKKSNKTLKNELEYIKNVNIENIDYKKLLISNKYIPTHIKNITLEKIEEMKTPNNEYYKLLTFVKTIINYPWSSDDTMYSLYKSDLLLASQYLKNIEDKLNNLSYGHNDAKKSLLQTIAKWISNPNSQGSCFGLVGPPGVGKTLLAKSISKALDIPFGEITLGGQNDGELLHGHGYTYSGAQPGMIIKKMVEMGKTRCILYFDELDKACSKHGSINEITSILIHLTDPNMNKTFQDRFFQGIDFPLDKTIIIFSYNDSSLIDPILLDRITEIEVSPYDINDKINIVKNFIIPEIINSIGLQNEAWINIEDDIIYWIIENYTDEAGVRSIKRKIEQIFLTLNVDRIHKKKYFNNNDNILITKDIIIDILNKPQTINLTIHNTPRVGIINGLYATTNGSGGITPIQIFNNVLTNNYEIKLTGNQGDIMKESVHCSLTLAIDYIKRNLLKYTFINNFEEYLINNFKYGFHIHAPSMSTPKDGPSAGCAFTCAFISRILNKPIKNDIAMTGEIELTGKITKIGGLNFKLLGAKKAGVKLVFVPEENKQDIETIINKNKDLITNDFNIKYFNYIDDIIDDIIL
jgi:endopeptidase La